MKTESTKPAPTLRQQGFRDALQRLTMTLMLVMLTATATWAEQFPIYTGDEGTEAKPYQIKTAEDLIMLSEDVNSGTTYEGKYFKLMNNINFSEATTTLLRPSTAWDDATSTENNFSPIGSRNGNTIHKFQGHFDGNEKYISGIRIYNAGTSANNGGHQGLFGYIGSGAEVKAVTLTNTRITGHNYCGGIVGRNEANTTVSNCHVTNTVAIHTAMDNVDYHGGIIGFNISGTVNECTSAATLTLADTNFTGCEIYGGIVGFNNGTLTDNIANGATIPAASNENKHGAIAGDGYTTAMQRNYYLNCNVAGTANATGVGMKGADATVNGAAVSIHTLTLTDGVTTATAPTITISGIGYYAQGTALVLDNGQAPTSIPKGYIYSYTVNGESVTTTDNTVAMPVAAATIGLGSLVAIPWTGSGTSADDPYVILYTSQLDLLATNVNSGTTYSGTYFQLGDDLAYDYGTAWDSDADYTANFTPIGKTGHATAVEFQGHFDGNGHTISGLRIHYSDRAVGLFGAIKNGATVSGITLDDARIIGNSSVGAIVGRNEGGTVSNCTVTNHVAIHINYSSQGYGGIVGTNVKGTVTGCTSSVQMSVATGVSANYIGGIVGGNASLYEETPGTVTGNFAIGAVIPASTYERHAAIAVSYPDPNHYVTYANNSYYNCTVAGVANATNVGVATPINSDHATIADITENFGAVSLHTLTLADGITTTTAPTITISGTDYYAQGKTITLSGAELDPPVGIINEGYTVNDVAISGSTFTMPAQNTTVKSIEVNVYSLTFSDGVSSTTTPATTVGGTLYYKEGTTITLTGRPDIEEDGYIYPYMLNGKVLYDNTFTMPAQNSIVALGEKIDDWLFAYAGTESDPYKIYTTAQLDLLAQCVNDGTSQYNGKYFQLMNDLHYDYTTAWNSDTEYTSNYTAIGTEYSDRSFCGHFLGNSHTISGIRIYKPNDKCQGLFGYIGDGAEVSDVTIADARITGYGCIGGIVGSNKRGTVSNCHATADVALHSVKNNAKDFGGIVGHNYGYFDLSKYIEVGGTVSNCTSAVTITVAAGTSGQQYFGGVVGSNWYRSTVTNCRAIGATVPDVTNAGAIMGFNDRNCSLSSNTYHSTLVGTDAFNIGVGKYKGATDAYNFQGDKTGYVTLEATALYLFDGRDNTVLIAAYANSSAHTAHEGSAPDVSNIAVTLKGRTLYCDGDWNTLCLPFNVNDLSGTLLEGATVMELDNSTSSLNGEGVLTLNFKNATGIEAGKPYIVKWANGSNIENPVFTNVTINSTAPTVVNFTGGSFCGTYDKLAWSAETPSALLLGAGNGLFWPDGNATSTLGACRAYFQLGNGTEAREFVLNFGDNENTTGMGSLTPAPSPKGEGSDYYTLDGRKLSGEPSAKGVYVKNGRKVVVK